MKKIQSYDKKMAYFLVTPDEMEMLRASVFLELKYEVILKRAHFSEMVFEQYCIRADLKLLDAFLVYAEMTNWKFKRKKIRDNVKKLVFQIREAFFNPEVEKAEEAKGVVDGAMEVIRSEEVSRDPAYQELLKNITPLIEDLKALGVNTRTEFLKCYSCRAYETDNFEGDRSLLDFEDFPTGHTEMVILEDHEEEYEDDLLRGYVIVFKFMCPACNVIQTAVTSFECYDPETTHDTS